MDEWGFLENCKYLIHDRDTKFTDSFRTIIKSSHVDLLRAYPKTSSETRMVQLFERSV